MVDIAQLICVDENVVPGLNKHHAIKNQKKLKNLGIYKWSFPQYALKGAPVPNVYHFC